MAITCSVGEWSGRSITAEPGGSEDHAEQEEDRDLGQSRPLDRAREERRDQDDDADQGERRDERVVRHGRKYVRLWRLPPAEW